MALFAEDSVLAISPAVERGPPVFGSKTLNPLAFENPPVVWIAGACCALWQTKPEGSDAIQFKSAMSANRVIAFIE
jgi:hypothetical protein